MAKRDWTPICVEYIRTNKTLRELAEKYKVSLKSIGLKASAEDWAGSREAYRRSLPDKVAEKKQKLIEKTTDKSAEKIITWQQMVMDANGKALKALLAQANKAEEFSPSMMQAWLAALDKSMRIAREMNGYINPADQAKLDLARAELEIKKEEHARLMAEASSSKEPVTVTMDDSMERYNK